MTLPGIALVLAGASLVLGLVLGSPFSIVAGLLVALVALYQGREP